MQVTPVSHYVQAASSTPVTPVPSASATSSVQSATTPAAKSSRPSAPAARASSPAARNSSPDVSAPQDDPSSEQSPNVTREFANQLAKNLSKVVSAVTPSVTFAVDDQSDRMVIRVLDRSTHELIRQIPSEEMLQLARSLDDMRGLLVNKTA